MSKLAKQVYEFGPFRLDVTEHMLLQDGEPVPLAPKAFDTLVVLVQNSGHILEKEELMKILWPDTIVEEGNLTQNIFILRKALGEGPNEQKYIETIPKHGYRFVANVKEAWDDAVDLVVAERSRSRVVVEEEESGVAGVWADGGMGESKLLPPSVTHSPKHPQTHTLALLVAVLLVVGAGAFIFTWISNRTRGAPTGAKVTSIAVLPFKSLGADSNDEFLGLGMADTLITKLSNIRHLIVRPTGAVRRYSSVEQDPLAAGQEQRVDTVLEGSIQRAGEKIRVTVRLLNVRDGSPLLAGQFDEKFTDIFRVQDSISERVASALALKLTGEEQKRLTKRYTESAEAYQLYLKGRYFWDKRTPEGINKGIEYFEQAIEQDSNYALAYAGLADAYSLFGFGSQGSGLSPGEAFPKAQAAAVNALALDDTLAEAHAALALIRMRYNWDWPVAEREAKRAIELDPDYATAHQYYADYLIAMGRRDEAIAEMKRARELDPLSLRLNAILGLFFYYTRQFDAAVEQLRRTIEMDPHFLMAHSYLGLAYEQKGMYEEAIAELNRAITPAGGSPETIMAGLGHVYAMSGKRGEARKMLQRVKELRNRRYVSPYNIAKIYTGLGEKDHAFEWWQKASEERSYGLIFLNVDPVFDSLRSDPRFTDLVRRTGLPP